MKISIMGLIVAFLMLGSNAGQMVWAEDQGKAGFTELFLFEAEAGKTGGFGQQLEKAYAGESDVFLHGYTATWYRTNDLNRRKRSATFSLQYFNLLAGVNMGSVMAEIMMEYEHGGNEIGIRYGIIDYEVAEYLVLRFGKFLTPVGKFNEYLYPEYINKLNDRPIGLWHVIPVVWSEIGAQIRGYLPLSNQLAVNYAVYASNGLQQSAGEGGDIRQMRNNFRDYQNDNKALGGRLGFILWQDIEIGVSHYQGAYTAAGDRRLFLADVDWQYRMKNFVFRGEWMKADQEITGGLMDKNGFYSEAAYRIDPKLEAVARYDQAHLPGVAGFDGVLNTEDVQRATLGVLIYPLPFEAPQFNFKVNFSRILNDGSGKPGEEFIAQTTIGF